MKRKLKWIVLGMVIVVVIVLSRLDGIIRSTVETQTTASTKLNTTLDSASLSLLGGSLELKGLKIAPPAGFKSPTMFSLGGAAVKVSYGQLTKQPIHITAIVIDRPALVIEQAGGTLNVTAAIQGMPPSESSSDVRLVIDRLEVKATNVTARPGLPMLKDEYALTLPDIVLENIGNAEGAQNGVAIKEVVQKVLSAMVEKAGQSSSVPPELAALLKGDTGSLKAAATQMATDRLNQEVQKQLGQKSPEAGAAIQKGLGDLLKGDKK